MFEYYGRGLSDAQLTHWHRQLKSLNIKQLEQRVLSVMNRRTMSFPSVEDMLRNPDSRSGTGMVSGKRGRIEDDPMYNRVQNIAFARFRERLGDELNHMPDPEAERAVNLEWIVDIAVECYEETAASGEGAYWEERRRGPGYALISQKLHQLWRGTHAAA